MCFLRAMAVSIGIREKSFTVSPSRLLPDGRKENPRNHAGSGHHAAHGNISGGKRDFAVVREQGNGLGFEACGGAT